MQFSPPASALNYSISPAIYSSWHISESDTAQVTTSPEPCTLKYFTTVCFGRERQPEFFKQIYLIGSIRPGVIGWGPKSTGAPVESDTSGQWRSLLIYGSAGRRRTGERVGMK